MENMENKSDSKAVLLGVFLIISLLLGGFIIYDKLLKKDTKEEASCECEKCEVCEKTTTACSCANSKLCTTSNKYSDQLIFSSIGMFFVTSKGEVYYEPRYNTSDESFNESDIKNAAKKLLGNPGKYTVTRDIFYAEGNKHVFDYKLNLSNIRYGIELYFGNGGFNSTIAFVSTDGTISEISYGEDKMLFYKNVSGFSDIVAIVPYGEDEGSSAITYDTCGNSKVYISPRFN